MECGSISNVICLLKNYLSSTVVIECIVMHPLLTPHHIVSHTGHSLIIHTDMFRWPVCLSGVVMGGSRGIKPLLAAIKTWNLSCTTNYQVFLSDKFGHCSN